MSSDPHLWQSLFGVSLLINVLILLLPLLRRLRSPEEVSQDGIMALVEEGEESGAIEANEKELIENIFELNDTTARDVMTHRTDMVILSLEDSHEQIVESIRRSGRSRFPVCREQADDVVGILTARAYLINACLDKPLPLEELLHPVYFVPETVRADALLRDMQSRKTHMALVVDEYGGISGLVTMEDLLEEIVGNIYDEFDPQEQQRIIRLEDNLWRVSGAAELEELAQELDIELPEDEEDERDYDTLGGLVFAQLPVIPEDGSRPEMEVLGLRVRVESICERRVEWALVEKLPAAVEE